MGQGNISQFSEHPYQTTETTIKYRTPNSGNPLAFDDVDANFEILRKAVNGLVSDIGLSNQGASANYDSLFNKITEGNTSLTSTINSNVSSLASDISSISSKLGSHTEGNYLADATVWGTIYNVENLAKHFNSSLVGQITAVETSLSNDILQITGNTGNAGVTPSISWQSPNSSGSWSPGKASATNYGFVKAGGDIEVSTDGTMSIKTGAITTTMLQESTIETIGASTWQDGSYTTLTGSRKHFGGGGVIWTQNIWSQFPGASEVFILAHLGESYLYYWDVYEPSWKIAAAVGDNQGGVKGCTIRCSPGTDNNIQYEDHDGRPDIAAGTIKFYAAMAPGDDNTADVIWIKVISWR